MELLATPVKINRGSYMSAHDLLNLLNKLGERDKMRGVISLPVATSYDKMIL